MQQLYIVHDVDSLDGIYIFASAVDAARFAATSSNLAVMPTPLIEADSSVVDELVAQATEA